MTDDAATRARFEQLLRKYDELDQQAADAKDVKSDAEQSRDYVKGLLRDEVRNMGLGKGSKLEVEGVGKFSFTTRRYYQLPAPSREEFALLLIRRSLEQKVVAASEEERAQRIDEVVNVLRGTEVALLTIGQKELDRWCAERKAEVDEDEPSAVPAYVTYHEDGFVPVISLDSAKTRKREKAAAKAARQ